MSVCNCINIPISHSEYLHLTVIFLLQFPFNYIKKMFNNLPITQHLMKYWYGVNDTGVYCNIIIYQILLTNNTMW